MCQKLSVPQILFFCCVSVLSWAGTWATFAGYHSPPPVEMSPEGISPYFLGGYLLAVVLVVAAFIATDEENANELAFKLGFQNRSVPRWLRRILVGTHLHYAYIVGRVCRRRSPCFVF